MAAAKQGCDRVSALGCTGQSLTVKRLLCRELTAKLDAEKGITDNPLLAESPPPALEPPSAAPDADAEAADAPAEANGAPVPSEAEPTPEQQVRYSTVGHTPLPSPVAS